MSKRIPDNKVEEIFNAADIIEIAGDFLQLKKRGSNYFALSPWTNEKTPSCAFSPSKNIFKDFSTGRGGSSVTFLMELEGLTYVEALTYIANKYNIPLELEETAEDVVEKDHRESLLILNSFATKFFNDQMLESKEGRQVGLSYFKERGILQSTIDHFQLGYSPEGWDVFSKAALQKQFKQEYLLETGLSIQSKDKKRLLDRFRGRVMFPIQNHLGKVIGFGGRILKSQEKAAKYVNSPESPIYHKSKVLYGLYHSKQQVRDKDQALLVEGYMDVISLFQNGIENVVATSGTALTEDQIRLLKRFTKNVLLIYDADKAGINAALRGADLMLEQELSVKVLLLPEGEDPDSFVKSKGKTGFETYVAEQEEDFIGFKINHLLATTNGDDPAQKAAILHEVASTIARIPDQVSQGIYLQFAAEKLNVREEVLQNALHQALLGKARQVERAERNRKEKEEKAPAGDKKIVAQKEYNQETEILRLLFTYPERKLSVQIEPEIEGDSPGETELDLVEYVIGELEGLNFEDELNEQIRKDAFDQYERDKQINLHYFLNNENTAISALISGLMTNTFEVSENWEKFDIRSPELDENIKSSLDSAIIHFKFKKLKFLLAENREKMKTSKDPEEIEGLIKMLHHLTQLKQEISKKLGIVIHD